MLNGQDEDEDEDGLFSRGFGEKYDESESNDMVVDGDDSAEQDLDDSESGESDRTSNTNLSDVEDDHRTIEKPGETVKEQLRKGLDSEAQKSVTATISRANKEDLEKGRAVKKQRLAFDTLLKTRMKLQNSLIVTNTVVGSSIEQLQAEKDEAKQAIEAAEAAAFSLWNSLTSLREEMLVPQTGEKRKRASFSSNTPVARLWAQAQAQDAESQATRTDVLRKWSNRSQAPTVLQSHSRLNQSRPQTTVVDVIREHLSDMDRLMKRAHAPRSCAPLQLSRRITEDEKIYDDADFYSSLLKDLLEQKGNDRIAASNIDLGYQMRREAKTKRNVDTKASKGRKLRYTLHEKLQNFMAPENRNTWGEKQTDELFRSLFGQRMGLGDMEEESDGDADFDREDAGLMLFRS